MRRFQLLFLLSLLLLLGSAAFALQSPATQHVILSPDGSYTTRGSLDDEEPDTLYYDDDSDNSLYFSSLTNYWYYVRFTPPSAFQLRSVYFAVDGPSLAPCSLFVCTPNGTRPGAVLSRMRVTLDQSGWIDATLPDTVRLAANADFMIVLGMATGPAGWYPLLDGTTTTVNRSRYTTGNRVTGTYTAIQYDARVRAGGEFDPYLDLAAAQCYDSTTGNHTSFNMLPNSVVRLKAQIDNVSNQAATSYTVNWSVLGPNGQVDFTSTATGANLAAGASQTIGAQDLYTPVDPGEYVVTCICHATNDASAINDTTLLRFFVGNLDRIYRYDDNQDYDGAVSYQAGNSFGVVFTPSSYPAQVDTIRVAVASAVTTTVRVYRNAANGIPSGNPAWSSNAALSQGWNDVPVSPPVRIESGSFTVAYVFDANQIGLGRDNNQPVDAAIGRMGVVTVLDVGSGYQQDVTGNWCLQAHLTTALAPAQITLSDDTLDFGNVDTTGNTNVVRALWIKNSGTGATLNVTALTFNPQSIRSSFTPSQAAPISIAAGDSTELDITFDPHSVASYNGTLVVTNDSQNAPSTTIRIVAAGTSGSAADIPSGGLPSEYALGQNYPNPFNPTTEIEFALPVNSNVKLSVFNVLGQEVALLANGTYTAGVHHVTFDGKDFTSGLYFYKLQAGTFTEMKKMMLLK